MGIQLLSRPFESVFLLLSATIFLLPSISRLRKPLTIATLATLPAIFLIVFQNYQATGHWTTMPYQLSRDQYGIPTTFTFQPNPIPHRDLTPQQHLAYEVQSSVHGPTTDTIKTYFDRLLARIRFYRFFFLPPLYLALPAFLPALRQARFRWVALTILLFALGSNFYPYFYAHYIAALTCLFILISVVALERLSHIVIRSQPTGALACRVIIFLCFAHFTFWYALHLFGTQDFAQAAWRYETWDSINFGDPEGRIAIHRQLREMNGDNLVFVRYTPRHALEEWVYNDADIDHSRVVWARDLGAVDNERLLHYYPSRKAWLLEPDARPIKLIPYTIPDFQSPPDLPKVEPTAQPHNPADHPKLKFEEVH